MCGRLHLQVILNKRDEGEETNVQRQEQSLLLDNRKWHTQKQIGRCEINLTIKAELLLVIAPLIYISFLISWIRNKAPIEKIVFKSFLFFQSSLSRSFGRLCLRIRGGLM